MQKEYKNMAVKVRALELLQTLAARCKEATDSIDARLTEYVEGVALNEGDTHNLYEVLGALKLLRLLAAYTIDAMRVRRTIRLFEGEWENGGTYEEGTGGFLFSGLQGRQHYRLQPFQVAVLAAIYGPHRVIAGSGTAHHRTNKTAHQRPGEGEDRRRVVTDAVLFMTRKSGKTMLGAFIGAEHFFFGDDNAEIYCAANSQDQSKILFSTLKELIRQKDSKGRSIRITATEVNWKPAAMRTAKAAALSAGGKRKDGLFPQLGLFDEYGSADFVKGHSDMLDVVNVVQSGMGPRREPLSVFTTTAGYAVNGPFFLKLEGIKKDLLTEVETAELWIKHGVPPRKGNDFQFSLVLEPDEWDRDEETMLTQANVWKKSNPMIGVSVQADFYERQVEKARLDPNVKKEFFTKLLNVFQQDTVQEWVTPEQIRPLQKPVSIDSLTSEDGWVAFCGMDYSLGDDLHATSYLCFNRVTGEFFADMDGWMTEESIRGSSIRNLLEQWVRDGWLHVSPGATLQPNLPIDRIVQLSERLTFMRFGYDPYKAKEPINTLSAWILSQDADPKQYVVPMRQNFASYNPAVLEMDFMIRNNPPLITFSQNPMWPWEFGNCVLATSSDGMENRKPLKRNAGSDGCKVDHVQALLTALNCYDAVQGTVMTE